MLLRESTLACSGDMMPRATSLATIVWSELIWVSAAVNLLVHESPTFMAKYLVCVRSKAEAVVSIRTPRELAYRNILRSISDAIISRLRRSTHSSMVPNLDLADLTSFNGQKPESSLNWPLPHSKARPYCRKQPQMPSAHGSFEEV